MTQPAITLAVGSVVLYLDPDLRWTDEFSWSRIEEAEERSVSGARIVHLGVKSGGRPITLAPPDADSAWMLRAVLTQLQAWEAQPDLQMTLSLRGTSYQVKFHRTNGSPIEAEPVVFIANPAPGEIGDWYLVTLRLIEV